MKIKGYVQLFVCSIVLLGCSSVDVIMNKDKIATPPKKLLIGAFERRSLLIDNITEKNIREALSFEFSRKEYVVYLLPSDKYGKMLEQAEIRKVLTDYGADMFIQGTVAVSVIGDAFSTENKSMLSVNYCDKNGDAAGMMRWNSDDDITQIDVIGSASSEIVQSFETEIKKEKK